MNTKQMEMIKATTSPIIHLTSESDFDEFELSDEDVEEVNPMNERYVRDGGFTSISLKQPDTSFTLENLFY